MKDETIQAIFGVALLVYLVLFGVGVYLAVT